MAVSFDPPGRTVGANTISAGKALEERESPVIKMVTDASKGVIWKSG